MDENKFNLEDPYGYSYNYHDLKRDEHIILRRQMGGSSVMHWCAVGYSGPRNFFNGRLNDFKHRHLVNKRKFQNVKTVYFCRIMFQFVLIVS